MTEKLEPDYDPPEDEEDDSPDDSLEFREVEVHFDRVVTFCPRCGWFTDPGEGGLLWCERCEWEQEW